MKTALYPGSFDPITLGHLDIIERASKIFDKVVVGVLINSKKQPTFSVEEKINMINIVCKKFKNVEAKAYDGLLVDFAKQIDANVVIKGLRAVSDFEYEFQMALTNYQLNPDIETLFLATKTTYSFLSSSIVREVASYGGSIDNLVPDEIKNIILNKYNKPVKN